MHVAVWLAARRTSGVIESANRENTCAVIMDNPLLNMAGLPPFSCISTDIIEPAIETIIEENRERIKTLLAQPGPYSWDNLMQPLEEMDDRLSRAWSPVSHMNSVVNSDELRAAYNACLPKLSDYNTEVGQNRDLYEAIKSIADSDEFDTLTPAQRTAIEHALQDFHLSGVDLPDDKKQRFKEISQRLSELKAKFSENVLDATNSWQKHITDESLLAGMTGSGLAMAKQAAEQKGLDGWLLTLDFPSWYSVVTYADDRALREELYRAYVTRASDQWPDPALDNSEIMEEILALRHEQAQLLGFANYAERSLAKKMADSPDEVMRFLTELAEKAKPAAEAEMADVRHFAAGVLGITDLQAWDIPYVSEKMRGAFYSLSQEDLKPYFPVDRVVPGLFKLVERLFGVEIREREGVDVWHPDVKFYEVFDADGELRAQFYFDLYARAQKRGGAWMDVCMTRRRRDDGIQLPVAYMTCNSTPPIGDAPALFTHDEVITLFHEFGHGLHHMLTRIDCAAVSGISGVEWDAVELPSQFMENFCWEREALDLFAAHHESGEPIPDDLYERLIASKNFQAAMQLVRQLEFAIFDMRLHMEYDPARGGRIQQILDEVRDRVAVVKPPPFNRFQHSFSHIFAGGYAAGYYSYKWAEVLSADAFSRFEEEGLFNPEVGRSFRENILEMGGARPARASFVAFRGREPRIDALLRQAGLAA